MLNSPFFNTTARLRHGTACRSRQTEEIYPTISLYSNICHPSMGNCSNSRRTFLYIYAKSQMPNQYFLCVMSRRNALRHMRNAHRRLPPRYENRRKKTPQGGRFQTQGTARAVKNAPASPCGCGPLHAAGAARAARNAFVANRAGRAARMQNEPPYPQ